MCSCSPDGGGDASLADVLARPSARVSTARPGAAEFAACRYYHGRRDSHCGTDTRDPLHHKHAARRTARSGAALLAAAFRWSGGGEGATAPTPHRLGRLLWRDGRWPQRSASMIELSNAVVQRVETATPEGSNDRSARKRSFSLHGPRTATGALQPPGGHESKRPLPIPARTFIVQESAMDKLRSLRKTSAAITASLSASCAGRWGRPRSSMIVAKRRSMSPPRSCTGRWRFL